MAINYMTESGFKKLQEEIEYLETVKRPEIARQISEAREKGDLSENAEYDAAKEAQGMMEMKLANLKEMLVNTRILDPNQIDTSSVQILTRVRLLNLKTNQEIAYTIVPDSEASLKEKKISVSSPIAKGLLGKKAGEVADCTVPAGTISFKVLEITLPE